MRPSSCFWLALCILTGLCALEGGAQTPAPAPDCNSALVNLLPCLDYVQGNVSAPPQNCCVGLASVVKSNPSCLCILVNSSALPIQVNTTRALQLPALCNVATPNPSVCGGSVAPVQEPVPSPPVSTPVPPPTALSTPPTGTPPTATATPPVMAPSTPTTPSVAPSTPMTPSVAPSVAPIVAPSVAPVVAPSAPTSGPASSPTPGPVSEVPSPTPGPAAQVPALTPTTTPTGSVSSPPAPPPATDQGSASSIVTASLLSVAIMVSSILCLQL